LGLKISIPSCKLSKVFTKILIKVIGPFDSNGGHLKKYSLHDKFSIFRNLYSIDYKLTFNAHQLVNFISNFTNNDPFDTSMLEFG
jgi:hypothetical protein